MSNHKTIGISSIKESSEGNILLSVPESSEVQLEAELDPSIKTNLDPSAPISGQDILLQQWRLKCNISREYPSEYQGKILLKKIAEKALNSSTPLSESIMRSIMEFDQFIWMAIGITVSFYATPLAGKMVGIVGLLAMERTDQIIDALDEKIRLGDEQTIQNLARIGIIMGEETFLISLREQLSSIPQSEITQSLSKLIESEKMLKKFPDTLLPFIWEGNITLRIATYSALAEVQYAIQILCDRLFGTHTPMIVLDFENDNNGDDDNGKGLIPLLAILGIGASLFL